MTDPSQKTKWVILKYPYTLSLVCLGFFLLVPFTLKTMNSFLEVYPSLVLPSGATIAKSADTYIEVNKTLALGIDAISGEEKALEFEKLFAPLPPHFAIRVIDRGKLGLNDDRSVRVKLKYVPLLSGFVFYLNRKDVDQAEKEQVRAWLADRLTSLNCQPDLLIIRKVKANLTKATMTLSAFETTEEIRYELH